ncbi:Uma2 family endonuclease [Neolewinella agarilytica]|uniref:Endonuclease, Uma2 family (Restriction endonuclease fold) n=1 Tax=Neolewinella agarilytica TaxID=478744 RepID=A0A1H9EE88_9BACT|nr:Uma2 family endonuclease [Neolewinella agarilytica]SEQ23959.1 Endonuclease, Uma2 family (restriction endonuclease fold) [Neolewinella agarilytica]
MEAISFPNRRYTPEEYFKELEKSEHKLEYVDGGIRMMAGGSPAHNRLIKNAFRKMDANPNNCEIFLSDSAVSIPSRNSYFFPDLSAVCDPNTEKEEAGIEKLLNPCLIVEVLSESTGETDRAEKFNAYRQLDSFKEYILIDSRKLLVDTYYRESNELWHIRSYFKEDQLVEIRTLGVQIAVGDFYEGVVFGEDSEKTKEE